jgi:hypothetical protein
MLSLILFSSLVASVFCSNCVIPGSLDIQTDVYVVSCNASICGLQESLENVGIVNTIGYVTDPQTSSCPNVFINEFNFAPSTTGNTDNQGFELAGGYATNVGGFMLTYFSKSPSLSFTITIPSNTIFSNQANGMGFLFVPSQNPIVNASACYGLALQDGSGNLLDIFGVGCSINITTLSGSPTASQLVFTPPLLSTNTSCQRQGNGMTSGDFTTVTCSLAMTHPYSVTSTVTVIAGALNILQTMTVLPDEILSNDLNIYSLAGSAFFLPYNEQPGKIIFFKGDSTVSPTKDVCIYGSNGTLIDQQASTVINSAYGYSFFIYSKNSNGSLWSAFYTGVGPQDMTLYILCEF